jgi:hypothetical protein
MNALTAVNIFEEIRTQAYPLGMPRLTAVFAFEREIDDAAEYQFSLRVDLDGRELARAPIAINFLDGLLTRAIANFMGFLIPAPGTISFRLFQGEELFHTYYIRCSAAQPVQVAAR